MVIRQRLFAWLFVTLVGLGTVGAILSSFLPVAIEGSSRPVASQATFGWLYLALLGLLTGLLVLVGYGLRYGQARAISETDHGPIMRHAALVAVGVVALLALQGLRVLSWWDGILLLVALVLVELSFRTRIVSN